MSINPSLNWPKYLPHPAIEFVQRFPKGGQIDFHKCRQHAEENQPAQGIRWSTFQPGEGLFLGYAIIAHLAFGHDQDNSPVFRKMTVGDERSNRGIWSLATFHQEAAAVKTVNSQGGAFAPCQAAGKFHAIELFVPAGKSECTSHRQAQLGACAQAHMLCSGRLNLGMETMGRR